MNNKPAWRSWAAHIEWERHAEQLGIAGALWVGAAVVLYVLGVI